MASQTTFRLSENAQPLPMRGTFGASANTYYPGGCMVTRTAAGRAFNPTTADVSGQPCCGVSRATVDNRTGAELGGLDDSVDIETDFGVFGFDISGTTPVPFDELFVVDNHTVSIDSLGGTRGRAGVCCEVRANSAGVTQAYFFISPAAGAVPSGALGDKDISLGAWRLSTGAAIPAFSNGVADGFSFVDSEAFGLRINDDSTTKFCAAVRLPAGLDDLKDVTLKVMGFRTGTLDVTAALTVEAFMVVAGDLDSADTNAGGATSAFDAVAASTVQIVSRTLAAADVPPGPSSLTLSLTATAALDDDDLVILATWLEFSKKAA